MRHLDGLSDAFFKEIRVNSLNTTKKEMNDRFEIGKSDQRAIR
ncbi:MAG: hypothetical protein QG670_2719 [Thermoproteota archaeon]|nr:hypothetical protein [Thermoproteota archaeon]